MLYLLDTDHVSALQGGGQAGGRLVARLSRVAPDDYGTSIVTLEEQMRGRLAQVAAAKCAASYAALTTRSGSTVGSLSGSIRKTRCNRRGC